MDTTFWMVWNPRGGVPRAKHESESIATAEAERLARCNPGDSFYVLRAVHVIRLADVVRTELIDFADEQPF